MSALLKLERSFQDCVFAGNHDMAGQVVSTADASAEERVGIYVDAYRLRLLEILEDNYPGLRALVGDEEFDRLGRSYIDAHPSTHPSVRWFSRHLEEFLKTNEPYSAHPYLAEMAVFEWAQSMVFDAADGAQVAIEKLAALPPDQWPGLSFKLHPAVQMLSLAWNVPSFWQAVDQDEEPPELAATPEPVSWLLWRAELATHWRSLGVDEAWALAAAREGRNFAELCEGLCRWHEESSVPLTAASLLKRWLTDGLLTSLQAGH